MALVEIARFLDLSETQTAAAALRASGIEVFVQNENWGQTEAYLQLAMGGFRLWTFEEDAADARAFIAQSQASPPETAGPRDFPAVAVAALSLTSLVAPLIGWFFVPFLKRRGLADDEPAPERLT